MLISTFALDGFDNHSGFATFPSSSIMRNIFRPAQKCCASSRAATVFGEVPAAIKIVRAGDGLFHAINSCFHRNCMAKFIQNNFGWGCIADEFNCFLECEFNFFMVQTIAWRILNCFAVNQTYAAPFVPGVPALCLYFCAEFARMGNPFIRNFFSSSGKFCEICCFTNRFNASEEFFNLDGVIRH